MTSRATPILRSASSDATIASRLFSPKIRFMPLKEATYPSPPGMLPPLHSGCCATAIASLIRDDKQGNTRSFVALLLRMTINRKRINRKRLSCRFAPQDDRALSYQGQFQGRGISFLRQSGTKGEVPRPLQGRDRCARSERQPTHPPIASLMYCTAYNGRFTSQSSFFHGAMDVRTDIFGLYFSRKAFRLFA